MNEIRIFESDQFGQIRTVLRDGEPWFIAADVCRALEIDRTQTRRLDDDEKGVYSTHTPGGEQEMAIVNEPGLYALALGSRKPEAKAFKRWITHEVLPSIRKTGGYIAGQSEMSDAELMAKALIVARRQIEERNQQIERMKPKALFADAVDASGTSILIGDLAKLLRQNGVSIGAKRLFGWLRDRGYLIRRKGSDWNMPTQRSVEQGLFRVKQTIITHPDGHIDVKRTPKVTGKGQIYFVNKFLREREVRECTEQMTP